MFGAGGVAALADFSIGLALKLLICFDASVCKSTSHKAFLVLYAVAILFHDDIFLNVVSINLFHNHSHWVFSQLYEHAI